MEFKSLTNIETSFRQIRLFALVFICLCALVTGFAVWNSYSFAEKQRQKIYVLDNGKGGTGHRFDWSTLEGQDLSNVLLAGGLGADNCVQAAQLGCAGLDFNSGVESEPGIKDAEKITAVFQTLRAY